MGTQLECRIVLRYGPRTFKMGMYDPISGRYVPLGEHPMRDVDKVVGDLKWSIENAGHRLTFSELPDTR